MTGKQPDIPISKWEMGSRIHRRDWSKTSLGPIEQWPETLSSLVSTILEIKIPILICWGEELISMYNDAYRPLLGENPEIFGHPFREISSKAREIVEPQINQVLSTGEPVFINNLEFTVTRDRKPETAWFDYSYSPIRNSKGDIKGIIKMAIEVTERVRAENELIKLQKLLNERVTQRTINLKAYKKQLQELIYRLNKAQGRESRDIGRWLHDHLGQLLDICIIKTDQIQKDVNDNDLQRKIENLKELLLQASKETTAFVNTLKLPPILEKKEILVELMEWLAEQMRKYNLEITVEDDGQPKAVSEENHIILYECVRELCFNVVKHAKVDQANIILQRVENQVYIIIKDIGKGFNIEKEKEAFEFGGGFGLFNINERMMRLGGSMDIQSQPDKGTKILLTAPIHE